MATVTAKLERDLETLKQLSQTVQAAADSTSAFLEAVKDFGLEATEEEVGLSLVLFFSPLLLITDARHQVAPMADVQTDYARVLREIGAHSAVLSQIKTNLVNHVPMVRCLRFVATHRLICPGPQPSLSEFGDHRMEHQRSLWTDEDLHKHPLVADARKLTFVRLCRTLVNAAAPPVHPPSFVLGNPEPRQGVPRGERGRRRGR